MAELVASNPRQRKFLTHAMEDTCFKGRIRACTSRVVTQSGARGNSDSRNQTAETYACLPNRNEGTTVEKGDGWAVWLWDFEISERISHLCSRCNWQVRFNLACFMYWWCHSCLHWVLAYVLGDLTCTNYNTFTKLQFRAHRLITELEQGITESFELDISEWNLRGLSICGWMCADQKI